jgi:hypothetical protein
MIKMAGFGALIGAASAPFLDLSGHAAHDARSFFLLTSHPDEDLLLLRRAAPFRRGQIRVASSAVASLRQDLTVLTGGGIIDPSQGKEVRLVRFVHELRRRADPATFLLQVDVGPEASGPNVLTIEQNGVVRDLIDVSRSYRSIEVPGADGATTLRLQDGSLSVVKASCRHENCRKMGARRHGSLICAPNRLVATMPGRITLFDVTTG